MERPYFKIFLFVQLTVVLGINTIHAELLDKVAAVIDDEVITLSMVQRIQENISTRRKIVPHLYPNDDRLTRREIAELLINRALIQKKIEGLGHSVDDGMVEKDIKENEKRLNASRDELLAYLRSNNMTFEEYFELRRDQIMFSYFHYYVVRPLITITERQIKNEFYKRNTNNKTLTFKYDLVDFHINKSAIRGNMLKKFRPMLINFQTNGIIPDNFSSMKTNPLGEITGESLLPKLKRVLQQTEEGKFTKPIPIGDQFHVFFIRKKSLVESSLYLKARAQIKNQLFEEASRKIIDQWYKQEGQKHYIKHFL